MFGIDFKSYPTFINMITPCTNPCSCRGICLSNMYINFEHTNNPIWWNHKSFSPSPPTYWNWFPPFVNDFHLEMEVILDWEAFVSALVRSPHLSSSDFFGYGVWASMKLFCLRWFYECFWPLFQGMWVHCSRSCSTFNITFDFYIMTFNIGKIVWRHTSHCDQ